VEITETVRAWGTIPGMLRARVRERPSAVVVADGSVVLTLAEVAARAREVARGLMALGVERGDRVGVLAPNGWTWVVAACGVWDCGGVLVPLSTRFRGLEAVEVLRATGVRVLLASEHFMGTSYVGLIAAAGEGAGRPFAGLPGLRQVVVADAEDGDAVLGRDGVMAYGEMLARGAAVRTGDAEARAGSVRPGDLCELLSTSGTTGAPKAVMLDHRQILRGYLEWSAVVTLREGDRYPVVSPFSHGFGLNAGLLACLMRGATIVPVAVFDPDDLMARVERLGVTVLAGPPALFHRLLSALRDGRRDVSSLRVGICGAAAVPPELVRALLRPVAEGGAGVERMINAYGLIEGTVVSMTRDGDPVEVIAATAGRAIPGVEITVVDDESRPLPPGRRGEILVRGHGVMRGYWHDPVRTAETVDPAGRLHTGDIGELDPAGNITIVDRKKDVFIVGGFNAYPAEIESLLLRNPEIAQAAVVAIPDAAQGEVAAAWVVPSPGASPTPATLTAWSQANMSNFKVPRLFTLLDSLPVNANGKVDKAALRTDPS
jgi:acyl-CoA synthetase (AMP-forming)/AMP-acid ligase II